MKSSRAFVLVAAALVIGFLTARWCAAQSGHPSTGKESASEEYIAHVAMHQLESFVDYLQSTGQTNALKQFGDYSNASIGSKNCADLGITIAILQRLRDGHTNEAINLLEIRASNDIVGFAASYRALPAPLREKVGLQILQIARDYRTKYPFRNQYSTGNDGVADAFTLLDERASH